MDIEKRIQETKRIREIGNKAYLSAFLLAAAAVVISPTARPEISDLARNTSSKLERSIGNYRHMARDYSQAAFDYFDTDGESDFRLYKRDTVTYGVSMTPNELSHGNPMLAEYIRKENKLESAAQVINPGMPIHMLVEAQDGKLVSHWLLHSGIKR